MKTIDEMKADAKAARERAPRLRQRLDVVINTLAARPAETWDAGLIASMLRCVRDDLPEPDVIPCPSVDETAARTDVPLLAAHVEALVDDAARWKALAEQLAGALLYLRNEAAVAGLALLDADAALDAYAAATRPQNDTNGGADVDPA